MRIVFSKVEGFLREWVRARVGRGSGGATFGMLGVFGRFVGVEDGGRCQKR